MFAVNLLDDDDDLIINDKSLHYTRREYEDSETIQNNDNNVDICESRKNSKVITSLKKNTPYSPIGRIQRTEQLRIYPLNGM